jgi:hypothetical protein
MAERSLVTTVLSRIVDLFVSILCTVAYIITNYLALGLALKFLS